MVSENAMIRAILFYEESDLLASNWTRLTCRAFACHSFDEVPYHLSQLMEPAIIVEVARDAKIAVNDVKLLNLGSHGPVATVKWLLDMADWATPVQLLNLSYCLASTARYELAASLLARISVKSLIREQPFAYWMIRMAIANRLGDSNTLDAELTELRNIIDKGLAPEHRVLHAASQAIVWHIKTKTVSDAIYQWFVHRGLRAAALLDSSIGFEESLALSSFYRAYAMIPAAENDAGNTRSAMAKAAERADDARATSSIAECRAIDARKTVLESQLKEMLYLQVDYEKAEATGQAMIGLDPNWSISYQELAEVHITAKQYKRAIPLLRKAIDVGLPRLALSQYLYGACLAADGDSEPALTAFEDTLALDSTNISAGIAGFNLAVSICHPSIRVFREYINRWETAGVLTARHKELFV